MLTTRNILWSLAAFYIVVAIGYSVWTSIDGSPEWVGIVAFFLMFAFTAFLAFYFGFEEKPFRKKPLPEDRENAEIDEADGELGWFSPHSMWPFVCAAGVAASFASIAFGWWPIFWFAPFAIIGLLGWMFQYYRGKFGH